LFCVAEFPEVTAMSSAEVALGEMALGRLVTELGQSTPGPGGGAAAATACSLAAGLVEMSARFTLARPDYADRPDELQTALARAGQLRGLALDLGQRELGAYAPVVEALALSGSDPERPARLSAALSAASEAPLEIARVGAELAELGVELARTGNPNLIGDVITGVLLAEAGCRAAACLVTINLGDAAGDQRISKVAQLTRQAAAARKEALTLSSSRRPPKRSLNEGRHKDAR
jgi:formiminotetrahydrofolate cyclodeaminase